MSKAASRAQEELAANLNALCQGAVTAAAAEPEQRDAFVGQLIGQARELRASGSEGESIADFLDALSEVLSGRGLDAALVGLVEPFRQGLRAVALDIDAARAPQPESAATGSATAGPEASPNDAEDPNDWVAALAAQTVTLLKDRDVEAARALVAELKKIRVQPGIDPDASAFLELLEGVLSGADVRAQALRLAQPYRDAYFSMQKLMMGGDPRKALLKRVEHNASLVMREGGEEARTGLGDVLDDLRRRAEAKNTGELAGFIEAVGRLVDGEAGFSATEIAFQDEELQAAWLRIRQAWSTPPPG